MFNHDSQKQQSGAVVLAFMLVLIVGTSYLLVNKLNANLIRVGGEERTRMALNQAKQALIGYAVMFPEIDAKSGTDPIDGPGYLPCADINNNGSAGGSCSLSGGTSIGRFPYKTLEAEDIKDSHGERLWYVVADNFRNNPKKLARQNSETVSDSTGNLEVNGMADIAAIIFAPGVPQNNQNRDAGPNDHTNYIEAVFSSGNKVIQTSNTDNYILLTKDELMQAVEKRVLGEVAQALRKYQTDYDAYPWLSPFSDPSTSAFKTVINTWQGHLPYHFLEDLPDGSNNRNPFDTEQSVAWDINNGTLTTSGNPDTPDPDENCMRSDDCTDSIFGVLNGPIQIAKAVGQCEWTNTVDVEPKNYMKCNGTKTITTAYTRTHNLFGEDIDITYNVSRTYSITFEYTDIDDAIIANPESTSSRARTLDISNNNVENVSVQLSDTYDSGLAAFAAWFNPVLYDGQRASTLVLSIGEILDGNISVGSIQYDINIDDGEIPDWFVKNDWHKLIYVAYPESESPPGSATVCTSGTDCLVLDGAGNPENNNRGLVIIAGAAINNPAEGIEQDRTAAPGDLLSYFEGMNSIITPPDNEIFEKGKASSIFNDQIKVLATP